MLFNKKQSLSLFFFLVFYCLLPIHTKLIGAYDGILSDGIFRNILESTLNPIKMNKNKHGIFHQYDFSVVSFGLPLAYRMISFNDVVSFMQYLMNFTGHDKNLKYFFSGDKRGKYGSIYDDDIKYKFLEKYKNLTYSSSESNCAAIIYSWFVQIKKSNVFVSYGFIYEYSNHVYSFNHALFNMDSSIFRQMKKAYDGDTVLCFMSAVDEVLQHKYQQVEYSKNDDAIKPDTNSIYADIVEKFTKKYVKDEGRRANIKTLSQLYVRLDGRSQNELKESLKEKYLDYSSRDNWDEKAKYVSFSVNDFGVHLGISYIQNKIDPYFGLFFSCSIATGIQYITCVNGIKSHAFLLYNKFYDNNWYAFLKDHSLYKGLLSIFIKIRIEAGYGPVRFFLCFKSFDVDIFLNAHGNIHPIVINEEGNKKNMIVKIEEYNEACYDYQGEYTIGLGEIKKKGGFKRFLPTLIQFGFSLNI